MVEDSLGCPPSALLPPLLPAKGWVTVGKGGWWHQRKSDWCTYRPQDGQMSLDLRHLRRRLELIAPRLYTTSAR